jgi:hypothetical protein
MLEQRADSQPILAAADGFSGIAAHPRKPFVKPSVEELGQLSDLTHTGSGSI